MNPIADLLPPELALETEQIARLIYETREHRQQVLAASGAEDEARLLALIAAGQVAEHPAYEHYLAARILAETHAAAREAMAHTLQEVKR